MGNFEQAGASVDKALDNGAKYVGETTEALQKSASNVADEAGKSFLDKALAFSKFLSGAEQKATNGIIDAATGAKDTVVSLSNGASDIGDKAGKAFLDNALAMSKTLTNTEKGIVDGANVAIASIGDRIDSFQNAINSGAVVVLLEGTQFYVETRDKAGVVKKMAMDRINNGVHETLAFVDGNLQYVADVGREYSMKAEAIARVAYNNTTKPLVDGAVDLASSTKASVVSAGNSIATGVSDAGKSVVTGVSTVASNLERQYTAELAAVKGVNAQAANADKGTGATTEKVNSPNREYVIASGDTLTKIAFTEAGKSGVQDYLKSIIALNPGIDPNKVKIGQKITLPTKQA